MEAGTMHYVCVATANMEREKLLEQVCSVCGRVGQALRSLGGKRAVRLVDVLSG